MRCLHVSTLPIANSLNVAAISIYEAQYVPALFKQAQRAWTRTELQEQGAGAGKGRRWEEGSPIEVSSGTNFIRQTLSSAQSVLLSESAPWNCERKGALGEVRRRAISS